MADRKKKMPTIKGMTVELTAEEVLALRVIHSNWAHSEGDAPFCDAMSEKFLERLGGHLEMDGHHFDHPIAKKWYDQHEQCSNCNRMFPESQLKAFPDDPDALSCEECLKDAAI